MKLVSSSLILIQQVRSLGQIFWSPAPFCWPHTWPLNRPEKRKFKGHVWGQENGAGDGLGTRLIATLDRRLTKFPYTRDVIRKLVCPLIGQYQQHMTLCLPVAHLLSEPRPHVDSRIGAGLQRKNYYISCRCSGISFKQSWHQRRVRSFTALSCIVEINQPCRLKLLCFRVKSYFCRPDHISSRFFLKTL